jgi:hypothetical protein
MVCHNNAIACIEGLMLALEEVIRVVEMDILIPSFLCSLMSSKVWISGDKDSCFNIFVAKSR